MNSVTLNRMTVKRDDGEVLRPTRRTIQAEDTRRTILDAARELFASKGFAATSIRSVAESAGVSVQTIYDSVGSKGELIKQLADRIDEEADIASIAATLERETSPTLIVRVPATITRRILERCGDLVRASYDAARTEPELASIAVEGGRRHRLGAVRVVQRLVDVGALDPLISSQAAATTIAALSDIRLACVLTDDHGLDPDAIENWIAESIGRAVLTPGADGTDPAAVASEEEAAGT